MRHTAFLVAALSAAAAAAAAPFTIPEFAPLYPPQPYSLSMEITNIRVKVDASFVSSTLPPGVVPVPEEAAPGLSDLMLVTFADYDSGNTAGPYHEVVFGVFGLVHDPRALDGSNTTFGFYTFLLYLDSLPGIATGREIGGFPKKQAAVSIYKHDDWSLFMVSKHDDSIAIAGVPAIFLPKIMKASFRLGDDDAAGNPEDGKFPPILNRKIIPSVEGGNSIDELTATWFGPNQEVTNYREGTATLELIGGSSDPLDTIPVVEVLGAAQYHLKGEWRQGHPYAWKIFDF